MSIPKASRQNNLTNFFVVQASRLPKNAGETPAPQGGTTAALAVLAPKGRNISAQGKRSAALGYGDPEEEASTNSTSSRKSLGRRPSASVFSTKTTVAAVAPSGAV